MFSLMRAGLLAALVSFACFPAIAAEKAFHDDALAESSIKLEAQIKTDSGPASKPVPALKRDADAAFQRNDFRGGMALLGQIVAAAPTDTATWLRLARTILQINPADNREKALLLERASTAAYIAYERTTDRAEETDSLLILGRTFQDRQMWRSALDTLRLSLELREVAEVRGQYERLREQYGFRVLDFSVDADAASPRACFQFSEELPGKRTDFSPFVVVGGIDKPAISAQEKQLCVEGLKHGEQYGITLRAGLPSVVHESLIKSSEYSIYVRDRSPFVHFTSKSYVLPRTGQRGIPIVSVNTRNVGIEIYRIGDRNLIDSVVGGDYDRSDFQRSLDRYEVDRLAQSRGVQVWKGNLAVESTLNTEITTAFPVDQAVGDLTPGVYVMVAEPQPSKADSYDSLATQWFIVSDLGLTAFSGNDGIHAFINSLASTDPKSGIEVRLISRSNEVLATRRTDAAGHAQFEAGLARGEGGMAPALLVAADPKGDYAFLNLKTPAFDLTDRGVSGRIAPSGLDAFVYPERGVYRTGETAYLTALLRDAQGLAAVGVPLTMVVERPDGVEYRRAVLPDQGVGGHSLKLPITASAPTGTWRVQAYTDPKRPPVGETTFLVEDYIPDRIEFDLTSPTGRISTATPADIKVDGHFLYGAPAAGLDLDGEIVVTPAKDRPGFGGYQFGLADEETEAARQPLEDLPATDATGKASFTVNLDKLPTSTHPLEADVTVRMAESGGRAVERKVTLPITASGNMIGVKPLFSGRSLGEGESATFDVVMVAPDGTTVPRRGLHYELVRIDTRYTYYKRDGNWNYEPIKQTSRVADGLIDTTLDKAARISLPVQWGRYRLEVSTGEPNGVVTSIAFDAGWYTDASADTPDMLEIALDKGEYKPGDTMTVAVTARTAGQVTLNVIGDRLITTQTSDVQPGLAKLQVPVGRDWGNGAYVVATLRRPLDAVAQRMPGRAIGVQWFSVDRKEKTLALDMKLPPLLRPNSTLRVPVKVDGLAAGEEARIVVAAVDVGILNLTNYKPPAPDNYYLGQRRLSAEIRDLYGQLIDGMQGTRGQIRSGGDSGAQLQGSPPIQAPLALYSGLITVGADGTAEVAFDIPDFAGSVRVMAVAWSKEKVGRANGDVIVRDPVVLTATLPRFLLHGDRANIHLELDNVEGQPGEYSVALTSEGPVVAGAGATQKITLAAKQRASLSIPVAASGVGTSAVHVSVAGPGGFALERSYSLTVRPATQILARRTVKPIVGGQSLTLSNDVFADLVPGTGGISLSIGVSSALDAATLLKALDRYPHGCSEQITSRALPLLYVNELAGEAHLAFDTAIDERIRDAINRLLDRQGANGSFGLWSVGGDDAWLDSYVTDFLSRARERNFAVPDVAFRLALDRLRNVVANTTDAGKNGGRDIAYALYVLARNGAAPVGDLRYIADTKLDSLETATAKAQIAAALAMIGDRGRAERVYAAALQSIPPKPAPDLFGRVDYGSTLRDAAALVTLASEGSAPRPTVLGAVQRVEAARSVSTYTSTQEDAWLVLAARAMAKDAGSVSLNVAGEATQRPLYRNLRASDLKEPFRITNTGDNPLQAVVTVTGAPLTPEPAAEKGFKIERLYYTLDGEAVDPTTVKQNTRMAVVLKMTEPDTQYGRIIVTDYLPAGFEIDNPRLVSSGDTGTLGWITDAVAPVHSEFRDDRFVAAFDRKSSDPSVFTVAYIVRAVSPGQYVHPQAYVEDMYRPDRFGRTATDSVEVTAAK